MGHIKRFIIERIPHHIVHKGNKGNNIFRSTDDYETYLSLLKHYSRKHELRILSYCLMTNHVHIVGIPFNKESLINTIRDTHQKYSHILNQKLNSSGHNWQNRYFACPCDELHTMVAIMYVELNPVRAGLVDRAWHYLWSSARFHVGVSTNDSLLDTSLWRESFTPEEWKNYLTEAPRADQIHLIRKCTYSGMPFGNKSFEDDIVRQFGIEIIPRSKGRPKKNVPGAIFV